MDFFFFFFFFCYLLCVFAVNKYLYELRKKKNRKKIWKYFQFVLIWRIDNKMLGVWGGGWGGGGGRLVMITRLKIIVL